MVEESHTEICAGDVVALLQLLDQNNYRDVKALCNRFGLGLPAEYARFNQEEDAA